MLTPSNGLECSPLPCVDKVIPVTTKSLLQAVVIFEMKYIKCQDSIFQNEWYRTRSCVCYPIVKCCSSNDPLRLSTLCVRARACLQSPCLSLL
jgi:hypothetical protein